MSEWLVKTNLDMNVDVQLFVSDEIGHEQSKEQDSSIMQSE